MFRPLYALAAVGTVVAALSAVSVASAQQSNAQTGVAQARLDWAKRHVELVCKPLEAKGAFDRATRCYNDVTRLVGDVTKTALPTAASYPAPKVAVAKAAAPKVAAPKVVAQTPVAKVVAVRHVPARRRIAQRPITVAAAEPAPFFTPSPIATQRCSGISCIQRYTLLGVGF